jgi:hypothetical protein
MNTLTVNIPVPAIVQKGITWLVSGTQPIIEAPAPATRRRQYRQRRTLVGQLVEDRNGLIGVVIARNGRGVDASYIVSLASARWSDRYQRVTWQPTGQIVYRRRHELAVVR